MRILASLSESSFFPKLGTSLIGKDINFLAFIADLYKRPIKSIKSIFFIKDATTKSPLFLGYLGLSTNLLSSSKILS